MLSFRLEHSFNHLTSQSLTLLFYVWLHRTQTPARPSYITLTILPFVIYWIMFIIQYCRGFLYDDGYKNNLFSTVAKFKMSFFYLLSHITLIIIKHIPYSSRFAFQYYFLLKKNNNILITLFWYWPFLVFSFFSWRTAVIYEWI